MAFRQAGDKLGLVTDLSRVPPASYGWDGPANGEIFVLQPLLQPDWVFWSSCYHWEEDVRMLSDWHETIEVSVRVVGRFFLAKALQGASVLHLQTNWTPCLSCKSGKWSGWQPERFCIALKKLFGFHKNVVWGMHRLLPSPEKCGIFSVLCTITTEETLFMLQKHDLYWQQSPGIFNFLKVWIMWEFSVIKQ